MVDLLVGNRSELFQWKRSRVNTRLFSDPGKKQGPLLGKTNFSGGTQKEVGKELVPLNN